MGDLGILPGAYTITQAYLDTTSQNRPGPCSSNYCWEGVKGIVVHRTASASMDARAIRQYFNDAPDGRYASSQYVVDDKVILEIIPIGEVAYHTSGKNMNHIGIETCEYNWGTATWPESYKRLVWLVTHLVKTYGLSIAQVTGHFWWDPTNRPYDPTHMGWTLAEGSAKGLFDWNQFIADVHTQITAPQVVPILVSQPTPCTDGLLINSTTYVPIRAYTTCVEPGATVRWDPSGKVVVDLPPTP
ncbi:MAG: N-acetylmuramoyl-L-alanine amidase family protein [Mycobacterium leprae]